MRCFGLLALLANIAIAARIPEGATLEIRLTSAIHSADAKVDQPVTAIIIVPVLSGERIAIAAGTKVVGHIQQITPAADATQQVVLTIAFDRLVDSVGRKTPIAARLTAIDNSRETADEQGRILGIVAKETGAGRLDQGIGKIAEKYPGLGDILGTVKKAVVGDVDPSIRYEPGVEMTIELTKPLDWTGSAAAPRIDDVTPVNDLLRLVSREPFRTMAEKPAKPSDLVNFLFLGSQAELEAAFKAAGWSPAQSLSRASEFETFRALATMREYREAPVSTLLLDGIPPALVFEKLNNTFAQRHHLRIWRRPEQFQGRQVWLCSATHDVAIDFSEENHTFIHKIDPNIDRERAKVVNDLMFTGLVKGLSLVDRPGIPSDAYNATGDRLITDGRLAVIEF
jgi:hypothetical protein